jgi:hypothetical protein
MNNETEVKVPANVKKLEKALQNMEILMKEQHTRMNHLEKEFTHFKKMACSFIENIRKNCEKKPRKASGFVLPGPISNELCDFLDIPHGSQASRTEVTKYLIAYIDENDLIDPEKKTLVVPNDRLHALLGPTVDLETLTRFTMQKYMNRHYLPRENISIS